MEGKVKFFDHGRHFGFVGLNGDPALDYYFHESSIIGPAPKSNDLVTFWLDDNRRGDGLIAVEVQVIGRQALT